MIRRLIKLNEYTFLSPFGILIIICIVTTITGKYQDLVIMAQVLYNMKRIVINISLLNM